MIPIEIPEKNFKGQLPECWEELTPEQYTTVAGMLLEMASGETFPIDIQAYIVRSALGLKDKPLKKKLGLADREEIHANLFLLAEQINFFLEENGEGDADRTLSLKLGFTKNLLPTIAKTCHGPADAFDNLTYIEFLKAHEQYVAWYESKEVDCLYELAAILYRPRKHFLDIRKMIPGFDGEERQAFNDYRLERRLKRFKKLPLAAVYAVFLWFESCMQFLIAHEVFGVLFSRDNDADDTEPSAGGAFRKILFDLSGGKFGDFDKTANTYLYTVLLELVDRYHEAQRIKSKSKSNEQTD